MRILDVKERTNSIRSSSQIKVAAWSAIILVVVIAAIGGYFYWLTHSAARDQVASLESVLVAKGAVKQCSKEDAGHGPDNYKPWYFAIYTVTKDRVATANLVRDAARQNGYSLVDRTDSNPLYDQSFLGAATKGNLSVSLLVHANREYVAANDSKNCTTTKQTSSSHDVTTFELSAELPATN